MFCRTCRDVHQYRRQLDMLTQTDRYQGTIRKGCDTRRVLGLPSVALTKKRASPQAAQGTIAVTTGPDYSTVSRNLALELVRVTEAAALAGAGWLGKGDKNAADQAAVDMMREVLSYIDMDGVVVIGEGEKDEAPMLFCGAMSTRRSSKMPSSMHAGERIGTGNGLAVDVAVDPLDGTSLVATGRDGAIAVIALAERGALYDPGPCMYMEKLAVGPQVDPGSVSLDKSVAENLHAVSKSVGRPVGELTVLLLDRPRHVDIMQQVRACGARIRLISDGDVGGAIETAKDGAPVDIMMGIGGTPEGVIAAAALKCMGGSIQGRLHPRSVEERRLAVEYGKRVDEVLSTEDLCRGDEVFFAATGVSDGDLLRGVRYSKVGATSNSIVMRNKSKTVRFIETTHRWDRPSITNVPQ